MWKMLKMLPSKIKAMFLFGSFLVLIYVLLNIMLPNLIGAYIKLMLDENSMFELSFLDGRLVIGTFEHRKAVTVLTIIIVVQTLLTALLAFLSTTVIIYAAEMSSYFFRVKLFEKIQKLSLKNIADLKSESIITRVSNDIALFWEFLVNGTTIMIKSFFLIIGGVVFSILVSWKMALSIIAIIPVVIVLILVIGLTASPMLKRSQKIVEEVTKAVNENVSGIRVIKTFNLEEDRINKFKDINHRWFNISFKSNMIFTVAFPIFYMILNWLMIGIFAVAGKSAHNGTIDIATIANINVFIDYLFLIAGGILLLLTFLYSFFRARVAAGRVVEILSYKVDDLYVAEGKTLNSYDIEVNKLSYKYYESSPNYALVDVSVKLPFGKTLGVIGPTGSGKSTFVNLLMNNYVYSEGSIKIGNEELNSINTKNLHDSIGIVYQEALMYTGTIRSNLLWAKPDATDEEINEALENACAKEFISKFPDGLDHPVLQSGKNLSGGQKQRLSVARTLLRKPKILILDDSTSALDNITTKKVINNVKEKYNCSTIIVSQKIGAIKNADEILVLSNGGFVIGQGKHNDLMHSCEFYKQIHETQLEQ
ncbi:ABC transporter ATP-binding protein [Mycoplasmopsis felifaucium]|uniref:ABC transporter ATP-binding protein n=1 Tax=Mycoplasmopsis felifaucium TaxID=35768 RepID=A0ABZ2RRU0_9BACT